MTMVVTMVVASAGSALAKVPVERGHYEGSDPVKTFSCAWGDLLKNSNYWGSYSIRASSDGQATLTHDTFEYVDTYTDAKSGEFFTVEARVNLRDAEAQPLPQYAPARVYEFNRHIAVQAKILDDERRLLTQGGGRQVVRIVYNLDTKTVLSAEYTTANGLLPWNDVSVDWCDMAADIFGHAG